MAMYGSQWVSQEEVLVIDPFNCTWWSGTSKISNNKNEQNNAFRMRVAFNIGLEVISRPDNNERRQTISGPFPIRLGGTPELHESLWVSDS